MTLSPPLKKLSTFSAGTSVRLPMKLLAKLCEKPTREMKSDGRERNEVEVALVAFRVGYHSGVDQARRNDVIGKGIAQELSQVRRIGPCGEGIGVSVAANH